VPFKLEVCGLLPALSLTLNSPVLVPVSVGSNTTLILHWLLAAKLVPHVVADTVKSPVVEIAMLLSSTLWVLVNGNVFAALVVPTFCLAYVTLSGVKVVGSTPVPYSHSICGLLGALSIKLTVPVTFPNSTGLKVTLTLHVLPAASVAPQVVEETAKLALGTMPLMFRVASPSFFAVTVAAELVVLIGW
jgi:hypothetical protein